MAQQRNLFSFFKKGQEGPSRGSSSSSPLHGIDGKKQANSIEFRQQHAQSENTITKSTQYSEDNIGSSGSPASSPNLESTPLKNSKEALWSKFKPPATASIVVKPPASAFTVAKPPDSDLNGATSRPFIPRLKRVQDEVSQGDSPGGTCNSTSDSNKRRKLMDVLGVEEGLPQGSKWAAAAAKFEWLLPNKIKDAMGRRPDHPLYDKRTLHIPPDVLSKMTASQRQYWTAKSKYMDTVLFFKVGKFYELYEFDAEIGQKEMDWKLTLSGVGKCRQVGVPESGIDDAVQKLVARGYKVGRVEQLETSEQAKQRGGGMVQRDLTHVVTPSTRLDGNLRPEAVHLLALREDTLDGPHDNALSQGSVAIGFAFVDAAAGKFYVGTINDDCSRSALESLLAQVAPQEILYELGAVSNDTLKLLRHRTTPGQLPVMMTPLTDEFQEANFAMKLMKDKKYFRSGGSSGDFRGPWPEALEILTNKHLAASALGALVAHLTRMKVNDELLPNGVLLSYEVFRGSLRLDGQSIVNLELLENKDDGSRAGTLLDYLDKCVTKFGKRMLRRWICHPLQNTAELNDRLDAVEELSSREEMACLIREDLRVLPDLERLVARVRGLAGSSNLGVVPMAAKKVHQRRMKTFGEAVQALRGGFELLEKLQSCRDGLGPPKARLLEAAMSLGDGNAALDTLEAIDSCIDRSSSAIKLYSKGGATDDDNDSDSDELSALEKEAESLMKVMLSFNEHSELWQAAVETLARLDILISFAAISKIAAGPTCRPQFVQNNNVGLGGSILDIKGLWHPYGSGGNGGVIVPNDVELGTTRKESSVNPRTMLLTGPNMGGKSTLLRATCLAVIMAQLGCFVPGNSCRLSPVDTIFTRLGASDRIMEGHSTFMVECTEAASVLRHATNNSLVVLDELGRGTSTFDGYAIAYAVRWVFLQGCYFS
uniref:DNA mismatch repair proteins mutS family domain-containing protein n=1 Tax=Physcomitrium patens TaxID=3218 RepID=A0A7I4EG59_PHYPA